MLLFICYYAMHVRCHINQSSSLVALHAIKETILGFYRAKKEYKKLVDTVK